jgi:dTDP-4-amino-4,6-dideoxy-D-galactose acyltransferase
MNIAIKRCDENDLTPGTINRLLELINAVYEETESDLWKPTTSGRTFYDEVEEFVKERQIFIARENDEIVGAVKFAPVNEHTLEFGMLAADKKMRGLGLGRDLVNIVENHGRNNGYKTMQLELLTPRHWKNPAKEFLKVWYSRLGYIPEKSMPFEEVSPHRIDEFATDCDFTVWLKKL